MRIDDIALFMPRAFIASVLKTIRINIDDIGKQEILKNGLYHITPNEEIAQKIIESEHLRPSKGIMKNFNSYGTSCVCLFNGPPDIENFIKNLGNLERNNPYLNPTMVANAVKIMPTEKSELENYKSRGLIDNVIVYEGYCILPNNKIQSVHLVPDLVRNVDTGEPIINQKTGKYDIAFREALPEELENDKKSYKAKNDYLEFIAKEREELGYKKNNNIVSNFYNGINTIANAGKIEGKMSIKNFTANISELVKRKIKQFTEPKLDVPTDEKIYNTINEFSHSKKNPYRDKKFGKTVAEFQKKGLQQLKIEKELKEITTSDLGDYFRQKYDQIDKDIIIKRGFHSINHNNRVAVLAMIIAKYEGVLDKDIDNRTKDILLTASYYHDIGRKKGIIVDNLGPHSKNSARKINKMELKYLNGENYSLEDKKILQAVVESHEGKDKNLTKICKKYKIDEQNMEYTLKLASILKDADALDRVRLDLNLPVVMITDLNPKYLRTDTSKQLLDASYQLEEISKKVSFDRVLAYRTDVQKNNRYEKGDIKSEKSERKEFMEYLRKGIQEVQNTKNDIRTDVQNIENRSNYKGEER